MFTPNYHDGVIQHLITDIPVDDFDVTAGGQVEIIGWLYQYYNMELHNYVVNITGGPVTKNEIPAATQLFTTDWVVRYMVDNSLGNYWLEHHPNSHLANQLEFQLPTELSSVSSGLQVEDLRIIDNAMGSGHILVYAFDVLMKIYQEEGYSVRDAALKIVQSNLYGLEIDKRAYQLTYFALMMKAREFNRRALRPGKLTPNVYVFEDTDDIVPEFFEGVPKEDVQDVKELVDLCKNARELGSIIRLPKEYDFEDLEQCVAQVPTDELDVFGVQKSKDTVLRMLKIAKTMSQKYDIAVTNPPYLNKFDPDLKKYVRKYYKDYAGDLFSVFIYKNINLVKEGGYSAYMTPFVWMFIKTYEKLRQYILDQKEITSLIQMEYSAFEEATVPINTFVLKNVPNQENGVYLKLSDFKGGMNVQKERVLDAIANPKIDYLYRTNQANFSKIPGSPIAYWVSDNLIKDFEIGTRMDEIAPPRVGLQTGNNNKFLREWYEVVHEKIRFNISSLESAKDSEGKWFPYNKGGSYRKWYGNYDYVVNWQNGGAEIRNFKGPNGKIRSRPQNTGYYFHEAITWSNITSGTFSIRLRKKGSIHDVSGMSAFSIDNGNISSVLGLMNSSVGNYIFKLLNPTINLQIGNFQSFPVLAVKNDKLLPFVENNIDLTKSDWDAFETSWDFTRHPLLLHIADDNRSIWYYSWMQSAHCAKNVPIVELLGAI